MPSKLQMKLLSPHGELLNVINCFGGQITVFRAHSQADLRPYQRALCGTQGPERFSIVVDGNEYHPQDHSLVGFGERLPQDGVTLAEYLQAFNVPELSVDSLLLSYGLEGYSGKLCSELTADEQRRAQLLAAIHRPDRALVMNEPFEPISASWRERFAELLTSFVRQRKAIVIVTSLSYRPECWIDNESVARVQVGEAIQKTVGFTGGASQAAELVRQVREDQSKSPVTPSTPSSPVEETSDLASTPSVTRGTPLPQWGAVKNIESDPDLISSPVERRSPSFRTKIAAGAILGLCFIALGQWWYGRGSERPFVPPPNPTSEEMLRMAALNPQGIQTGPNVETTVPAPPAIDVPQQIQVPQPPAQPQLVLDEYPEVIRASLLDTVNGILSDMPSGGSVVPATDQKPANPSNGNIFKLLESASNKSADRPGGGSPVYVDGAPPSTVYDGTGSVPYDPAPPPVPVDEEGEQAKREAIRQKFLEAIRAAAERRASGEGQ